MKKIFKCFIVALIFSIAYAAMPFSVEAVEVSDKFKGQKDKIERFLRQADEKELEEFSNAVLKSTRDLTIAQAVGTTKFALGVMERKFEAEKNSLSEAERQKRLDEIEEVKLALWMFEAVEQRKAELAEAKQQSLNAQKNSANKPEEKSFLDTAKETYDEYQMRKQAEEREKARLAEAERQRKIREEEAKKREQAKGQEEEGGWVFQYVCQPVLGTILVIVVLIVFIGIVASVLGPWGIALLIFYGFYELCKWLF